MKYFIIPVAAFHGIARCVAITSSAYLFGISENFYYNLLEKLDE
jgi:hypothetical protein